MTLGEDPKVLSESNAGSCVAVEVRLLDVGGWREGTCGSSGLGAPATEDDEVAKEELCSEELVAGGATDDRVEQEQGLAGRAGMR